MTRADAKVWTVAHDDLYGALEAAVGRAHGDRGHSVAAYRNAVRRLHSAGVTPQALSLLLFDYARSVITQTGPMALAMFVGGSEAKDAAWLVVSRWPSTCLCCSSEIARGALCWYRRDGDRGYVVCEQCESVPHVSERADVARMRALEKDDDPDSLLAAILRETPGDVCAQVEDALPLEIFVAREAEK